MSIHLRGLGQLYNDLKRCQIFAGTGRWTAINYSCLPFRVDINYQLRVLEHVKSINRFQPIYSVGTKDWDYLLVTRKFAHLSSTTWICVTRAISSSNASLRDAIFCTGRCRHFIIAFWVLQDIVCQCRSSSKVPCTFLRNEQFVFPTKDFITFNPELKP